MKAKKHGVRFSSLIHHPYFDFIPSVLIDPTHDLLLGTTNKMVKTWKGLKLLFLSMLNYAFIYLKEHCLSG